jgi:dinuclear metal center YbgI/SA1388 family protein
MLLHELENYTARLLEVARFQDYCPNGLQVEGRRAVRRVVSGVSASLALLEAAADAEADAVLVHHGYFWKGEDSRLVGVKKRRLDVLFASGMSLFAYHLPLDAHPLYGNNALLGKALGAEAEGTFGEQALACFGTLPAPRTLAPWTDALAAALARAPLVIGEAERPVRRVAWCSGAGQGYFEAALALGVDAFVTGEISERYVHLAREAGVAFVCAGHHATERFGVRALGEHWAEAFGLEHRYVEVENPV